jgi:hypothetical protein
MYARVRGWDGYGPTPIIPSSLLVAKETSSAEAVSYVPTISALFGDLAGAIANGNMTHPGRRLHSEVLLGFENCCGCDDVGPEPTGLCFVDVRLASAPVPRRPRADGGGGPTLEGSQAEGSGRAERPLYQKGGLMSTGHKTSRLRQPHRIRCPGRRPAHAPRFPSGGSRAFQHLTFPGGD